MVESYDLIVKEFSWRFLLPNTNPLLTELSQVFGPKRWNILPKYVWEVEELKDFRKKLETHLFRQYFYN